jgi:hypothetical protein
MLEQTRAFCRKYRDGRLPSAMPSDPNRKDGQWLAAKRRVKVGKASGSWYPEMDAIAQEEGLKGLFDADIITRERALDWLTRFYARHGTYPETRQGHVEEAAEDGYGHLHFNWASVNRRFPLQELIDSLRPPFTPDLVARWNQQEIRLGRPAISKLVTTVIASARSDGYPLSGSQINSMLIREHGITLAELLRPSNRCSFSVEVAEGWMRKEYATQGKWPTVSTELIHSAEADGYASLSGNALNKLLRKQGTTLREVKERLANGRRS